MHHISFSENEAAMLAAFDASSLHQGRIDTSEVIAGSNSINYRTVGRNIAGSSTGSGPDGLLSSSNTLPEHCNTHSEETLSYLNSCKDPDIYSSSHQKVSDASHCHKQNSNSSPDYATDERHTAEVELASSNHLNAVAWPTVDTSGSLLSTSVQRRSVGRLSEKIKQKLQQNAKVDTPKRLSRLSVVVQKYDSLAADVTDIGPFYGLPVKVKQLLETQRSITEFYRKFNVTVSAC